MWHADGVDADLEAHHEGILERTRRVRRPAAADPSHWPQVYTAATGAEDTQWLAAPEQDGAAAWLLTVVFRMVDASEDGGTGSSTMPPDTMIYERKRPSIIVLIEREREA
jgi:hypothetical protein